MDIKGAVNIIAPITAAREGFSASPYYDVNGYAIGYGNHYYTDGTGVDSADPPISQSDAYDLMVYFLTQNAQAIASQLTVPINNFQLAALIDVRYRYGSIPDLVNLINSGADANTVSQAIAAKSNNGTDVARADDESKLYLGGQSAQAVIQQNYLLTNDGSTATSFAPVALVLGGLALGFVIVKSI